MKEMIYSRKRKKEILDEGIYNGFHYVILSLGWHPTAYVEIPNTHPYYNESYNDCDIDCHCGLTYGGDAHWDSNADQNRYYLGWDYAHLGDYSGLNSIYEETTGWHDDGKQWTTEEIFEEVKEVIDQLKEIKWNC